MPAKIAPGGGGINRSGAAHGTLAELQTQYSLSWLVETQPERSEWCWRPAKPTPPPQTKMLSMPHHKCSWPALLATGNP